MPDYDTAAAATTALSHAGAEDDALRDLMVGLPASVRIMLNRSLFDQVTRAASAMAAADTIMPKHLVGKPQACFVVICSATEWKLNAWFVARNTYQTPGGQIGFMGALCQAILEQSGRLIGPITYDHVGDWDAITNMFEMKTGKQGGEYAAPTWRGKPQEKGLGVIVRGHVRGEDKPRVWPGEGRPFLLSQCHPLNSPLWATDPRTQICYLAVRRFGNLAVPGILGGVPFSVDDIIEASELARDITPDVPIPRTAEATTGKKRGTKPTVVEDESPWHVTDNDGVVHEFKTPVAAAEACEVVFRDAAKRGEAGIEAAWENNSNLIGALRQAGESDLADHLGEIYTSATEQGGCIPHGVVGDCPQCREMTEREKVMITGYELYRQQQASQPIPTAASQPAQSAGPPAAIESGAIGEHLADEAVRDQRPAVDPWWSKPSLVINPPGRGANNAPNWPAYAEFLTKIVAKAPTTEAIERLLTDNKRTLQTFKLSYRGGWDEVDEAIGARRKELAA